MAGNLDAELDKLLTADAVAAVHSTAAEEHRPSVSAHVRSPEASEDKAMLATPDEADLLLDQAVARPRVTSDGRESEGQPAPESEEGMPPAVMPEPEETDWEKAIYTPPPPEKGEEVTIESPLPPYPGTPEAEEPSAFEIPVKPSPPEEIPPTPAPTKEGALAEVPSRPEALVPPGPAQPVKEKEEEARRELTEEEKARILARITQEQQDELMKEVDKLYRQVT
ncbi:MAG TPA: hypothetical protein EYP04_05745, partial [Anaerolineae bacterium]|nr:hypothetical protein [Anaerolineae bacterium]